MAGRKLKFEALYPYDRAQVWEALTDSAAIADWLMPNDFKPVVGHRFNFKTKPAPGFDGTVHCEVIAVEPPDRLVYSWKGGGIDTIVSFVLNAEGKGTRLVMEQDGFRGLRGMLISRILGGGWKRMIEQRLPAAAGRVVDGNYRSAAPGVPDAACHRA
jgi:uncharacterized protein YndB with AHSA1/START domain